MKPTGAANYAVSRPGTLVYMPGGTAEQTPMRSLVWVDRQGHEERLKTPLRAYGPPRVSPDGTRLAISILDQRNTEIWIWNFAGETLRRLTFAPAMDGLAVWTPDSRRIIFMSDRTGVLNLYSQAADGTGSVDRLTTSANPQWPTSITPDGTWLAAFDHLPRKDSEVVFFPLTRPVKRPGAGPARGLGPSPTEPFAETRFKGWWGDFSPDGRYVAYQSNESGRLEVYVRPFPQVNHGRWQVSIGGGTRPTWARSGRELFYLDGSNTLITVPVQMSASTFSAGKPAKVFDNKYVEPNPARHYDVSPDGQRFLMIKDSADVDPNAMPASMVVVLNWLEELKQRVPTTGK
jgi:serine/threonine-protein kinase